MNKKEEDMNVKEFVEYFLDNPIHRLVFNRLSQIDTGEPKSLLEGINLE